jgi:hypothetical protein
MSPLVGFGAWRLHETDDLPSTMYWRHVWAVGGTTIARCLRCTGAGFGIESCEPAHQPPGHQCSCGLYARTTPSGVLGEYRCTHAVVLTWRRPAILPNSGCPGPRRLDLLIASRPRSLASAVFG